MGHAKRAGRSGALLGSLGAAMAALSSQQARAGDSYISLQGSFSAQNQSRLFDFSLGANALMVARTWGNPGGTNAAGELVAGNGIDSTLTLFNSTLVQLATDDDGGGGLNSQIANLYPAGNYLLRLSNPFSQGDGHWATDISAGGKPERLDRGAK